MQISGSKLHNHFSSNEEQQHTHHDAQGHIGQCRPAAAGVHQAEGVGGKGGESGKGTAKADRQQQVSCFGQGR